LLAKKVLSDCEIAHSLLEATEDEVVFRLLYISCISLLRSIGHVLDKVDSTISDSHARTIKSAYERWKAEPEASKIFWMFIEEERNNVLKEYELGFLSGPIDVVVLPSGEEFTLDENLFCPLNHGPYAGEDCRDVIQMAIDWWKEEINKIETRLHQ
jgi:hypothetical protein